MSTQSCSHCRARLTEGQAECSNCGLPTFIEASADVRLEFLHTLTTSLQLYLQTLPGLVGLSLLLALVVAACIAGDNGGISLPLQFLIFAATLPSFGISAYLHVLHSGHSSEPALMRLSRVVLSAIHLIPIAVFCIPILFFALALESAVLGPFGPLTTPVMLLTVPVTLMTAATFVPAFLPLVVLGLASLSRAWSASLNASRPVRGTLFFLALFIAVVELAVQVLFFRTVSLPVHRSQLYSVDFADGVLATAHLVLLAFPLAALCTVTRALSQQGCFRELAD